MCKVHWQGMEVVHNVQGVTLLQKMENGKENLIFNQFGIAYFQGLTKTHSYRYQDHSDDEI